MNTALDPRKIRQRLEERCRVLSARLREKQNQSAVQEAENADRSDLAQDYSVRDRNTALMDQTQETLDQIKAAIARLDADRYGRCERCSREIPASRLEALPHAELCIQCKKTIENQ
jgi:DnaK suppressor protein